MKWFSYLKSFFITKEINYKWISALLLFTDEKSLILDKGIVIIGNSSPNILCYYLNFSNFTVINEKLYYLCKNKKLLKIDPKKVYLHVKIGNSPHPISKQNVNYWNIYFSSPQNKIYNTISSKLNLQNISFINTKENSNINNLLELNYPTFSSKQIYGNNMDQIIFSDLNISFL